MTSLHLKRSAARRRWWFRREGTWTRSSSSWVVICTLAGDRAREDWDYRARGDRSCRERATSTFRDHSGRCRERGWRANALTQRCHGDVLVDEFKRAYTSAHDRNELPPTAALPHMARLRKPETRSDSTAEGVPRKRSGHCGEGELMSVGLCTSREM